MRFRQAKHEDVVACVAMGRDMHAESNFASVGLDSARVERFMRWVVESHKTGVMLVAEEDGELHGFMMALLTPAWFGNGVECIANELVLYVAPRSRGTSAGPGLVNTFKHWAQANGAKQIRAGTSAGAAGQAAGTLYERAGFECTGKCYLLDLATLATAERDAA